MSFAEGFSSSFNAVSNALDARDRLNFEKKKRDDELRLRGYNPDDLSIIPGSKADAEQEQINQALQLSRSLQGKLAAQDTDQALLDYSETGDAKYLQGALDKNPYIKKAWNDRGVLNIANVDFQNDGDMLARTGFKESEYDTPEKQDILKRNIYKFYDGQNWNIGLLNNVARDTGAITRLGDKRATPILDNHQNFRDFMAGPRSSPNTMEGHRYEKEIQAASDATRVPGNLIASLMRQENPKMDPKAVSSKGAVGLMQLLPGTAKDMGVKNIEDPGENIMGGAKYLAAQLDKYNGDTRLALAAYNAGPGAVDKYNGIPPYAETTNYVDRVMNNYAGAESYYNAGNNAMAEGRQLGNTPDLKTLTDRQANLADNRIATIRSFIRGNVNASQGTTNENEDLKVQSDALKAAAAVTANKVKLATEGNTAAQKDLAAADAQEKELVDSFGGEDKFFKTDFNDNANFNKAWKNVVKINKLQGNELDATDKKNISDIRSLITVADPASKISSKQTGIIDNSINDVISYISDSAEGKDRTAAMAVFRSSLRHALYGSTLTDGEIKSFDEAYGNNSQKLGPVLEKYKVALNQISSKLDSVARLGNPYTMHVLLGADQDKLSKIQTALQQRIDFIEGRTNKDGSKIIANNANVSSVRPQTVDKATFASKDARPSLGSIFGGAN